MRIVRFLSGGVTYVGQQIDEEFALQFRCSRDVGDEIHEQPVVRRALDQVGTAHPLSAVAALQLLALSL